MWGKYNANTKNMSMELAESIKSNKHKDFMTLSRSYSLDEINTIIKDIEHIIGNRKIVFLHYPSEPCVGFIKAAELTGTDIREINPDMYILDDWLGKRDIKFYFIAGVQKPVGYKYFCPPDKLFKNFFIDYWATFPLHMTFYYLNRLYNNQPTLSKEFNTYFDLKIDEDFKYLYLNYNNKCKTHRAMLMDNLCKNDLLKYGLNSWNVLTTSDIKNYNTYQLKYWEEKIINLDGYITDEYFCDVYDGEKKISGQFSSSHLKTKTLFNIACETSDESHFITEKTFKSIFFEQPFISLGGPNQNTTLLEFGFELYDEIFDYSFDTKTDLEDRVNGVIDNLMKYKDSNYKEIYELVRPKVLRNKQRLIEIFMDDPYNPYKKYLDFSDLNNIKLK